MPNTYFVSSVLRTHYFFGETFCPILKYVCFVRRMVEQAAPSSHGGMCKLIRLIVGMRDPRMHRLEAFCLVQLQIMLILDFMKFEVFSEYVGLP